MTTPTRSSPAFGGLDAHSCREVGRGSRQQPVRGVGLDRESPPLDVAVDRVFSRWSARRVLPAGAVPEVESPVAIGRRRARVTRNRDDDGGETRQDGQPESGRPGQIHVISTRAGQPGAG